MTAGNRCGQTWRSFEFEGEVYKSPLIPATLERIQRQLASDLTLCRKLLCSQYPRANEPAEQPQHCGHAEFGKFVREYLKWTQG